MICAVVRDIADWQPCWPPNHGQSYQNTSSPNKSHIWVQPPQGGSSFLCWMCCDYPLKTRSARGLGWCKPREGSWGYGNELAVPVLPAWRVSGSRRYFQRKGHVLPCTRDAFKDSLHSSVCCSVSPGDAQHCSHTLWHYWWHKWLGSGSKSGFGNTTRPPGQGETHNIWIGTFSNPFKTRFLHLALCTQEIWGKGMEQKGWELALRVGWQKWGNSSPFLNHSKVAVGLAQTGAWNGETVTGLCYSSRLSRSCPEKVLTEGSNYLVIKGCCCIW